MSQMVVGGEIPVVPLVPTKTHTRSADTELLFWLVPLRICFHSQSHVAYWFRPELCHGRTGRMYLNGLPAHREGFLPIVLQG